jgi:hypothetical protein
MCPGTAAVSASRESFLATKSESVATKDGVMDSPFLNKRAAGGD